MELCVTGCYIFILFRKKILRKSESSIILLNTNKLPYIKSIKIKGERKNEI